MREKRKRKRNQLASLNTHFPCPFPPSPRTIQEISSSRSIVFTDSWAGYMPWYKLLALFGDSFMQLSCLGLSAARGANLARSFPPPLRAKISTKPCGAPASDAAWPRRAGHQLMGFELCATQVFQYFKRLFFLPPPPSLSHYMGFPWLGSLFIVPFPLHPAPSFLFPVQ